MKNFTERHHAFISATYYKYLTEKFADRGEKAFIMATQRYAEQRGSRMAQRAIRDGKELNFKTYCEYGEWEFTQETKDEIKNMGIENQLVILNYSPDYEYNSYACPWSMQYKEMGLSDAAEIYCAHLDNSIARGFNPYLDFKTTQTIHNSTHCNFVLKDANLNPEEMNPKNPDNMKGFDYHCGHIYYTFKRITESIFGSEGSDVSASVLKEFARKYGTDMADEIVKYRDTDFDVI